ncbi:hypothetical protein BCV69DRAFT_243939 [Microstroma glucosiphilum]|uniref:Solute carrier family 40 member n=1 Tax=Pseudomicrostroma glucosiphilum TaxID=1684307 RepID=A0A316UIZ0_9BASI|nr:hypothetical protein BCV69DRAFT_243939 [Pseudomicrostroma glucosiphilum]PWN24301.1 hypothetical protein BCV69DRAFT_243939 [Pseudomicrostroma glucosiphilum]
MIRSDPSLAYQSSNAPLTPTSEVAPTTPPSASEHHLDRIAIVCLAVQHISSSWGYRSAEFAFPLYFAYLFPATLLPASVYGLCLLIASLFFSPSVGRNVDKHKARRLAVVRGFIVAQKLSVACSYGGFCFLFNLGDTAIPEGKRWAAFVALTFVGVLVVLSGTGMTIAVERDWVTTIAKGEERKLTKLNTIIRQIDLISKLLAPLFVSLLTTTTSYRVSAFILLGINCFTSLFEWIWIGTVYKRFTEIGADEQREQSRRASLRAEDAGAQAEGLRARERLRTLRSPEAVYRKGTTKAHALRKDLQAFAALSTFPTSIALALLYTSVLSFDSTFLTYLKQPHPSALPLSSTSNGIVKVAAPGSGGQAVDISYSDAFVSGMRGLCVAMGLLGTIIMPILSRRVGLVRLGSWSLFQEFISLTPTVCALWVGVGLPWNTACLFLGMALSRTGLWTYDLTQLALLQQALYEHPTASLHFGIQQSLINAFDLCHFVLTLVWNKPSEFARPASVSWALIGTAWVVYVGWYARRERGHVLHLEWVGLDSKKGGKDRGNATGGGDRDAGEQRLGEERTAQGDA